MRRPVWVLSGRKPEDRFSRDEVQIWMLGIGQPKILSLSYFDHHVWHCRNDVGLWWTWPTLNRCLLVYCLVLIVYWNAAVINTALSTATTITWAPSSEFVSSSIPSWQIVTAHVQPLRGARDLAFCLKVPLDSLLVWASSGGSGETARMRRLAWTFAARLGDKYRIRLTRSTCQKDFPPMYVLY